MDPDPYLIRIGIQPKMQDPDPDEMNADPQPCIYGIGTNVKDPEGDNFVSE